MFKEIGELSWQPIFLEDNPEDGKPCRKKKSSFSIRKFADSGYRAKSLGSKTLDTGPLLRGTVISRGFSNLAGTETKIIILRTQVPNYA